MTDFLGTPATAPGPLGPRMLRHTTMIRRDPLAFLTLMRDTYGDVVQFPIPRPPTYLVASAEATHQVLVGRPGCYDKETIQYRSLALVTGDGLLVAPDRRWRDQRPVVQPAFHHAFLPVVGRIVADEVGALVDRWRLAGPGAVVDVESAMMEVTLRVVGRSLFGDPLTGSTAKLAEATLDALSVVIQRSRVPVAFPRSWPTPANRRLGRALRELDEAVARLAAQGGPGDGLLLDLLLAQPGWSDEQIRNQVVTFLVAGHETAASALMWALWLIAGDEAEGDALADDPGRARWVADETLRLYPPAWVISRSATGPDDIADHAVPAGALVITSPYLVQRDSRYWSDPEVFAPDRFAARLSRRQREAFIPFGAGLRQCIGRDFARWEMAEVVAGLGAAFRFSRVGPPPRPLASVTLRPADGLLLRIDPRR